MEPNKFVAEGKLEVGPQVDYFTFLDGDHMGRLLVNYFDAAGAPGYCDLGRVRLTAELLEGDELTEEASPT